MKTLGTLLLVILACVLGSIASIAQTLNLKTITSLGDTVIRTFPPPDSTYVHNEITLKFYNGGLNKDSLCYDCSSIVGMRTKKKGGSEQTSGDSDNYYNEYFMSCKEFLMAQHFTVQIIEDPVIRGILIANGVAYLTRMSSDNPCEDTASITREGDTIPMDHYNWMEAHFVNDTSVVTTLIQLALTRPISLQLASFDLIYTLDSRTPIDPEFGNAPQGSLTMMGLPDAWDFEVGDESIKAAVIDIGVDYRRCELGAGEGPGFKVSGGWDFNFPTDPSNHFWFSHGSPYNHGTGCASVIAALTNNINCNNGAAVPVIFGMAGIAGGWSPLGNSPHIDGGTGVQLLGYRCGRDLDNQLQSAWLISGIMEAVGNSTKSHDGPGAHIVNCSWHNTVYDPSLRLEAGDAFRQQACMVVAKGDNVGNIPVFPADFDPPKDIITVGAANWEGIRDLDFLTGWNKDMDFLAPGGGSGATQDNLVRAQANDVDDAFYWHSATSGATPTAAGVLALLRSWFVQHGFGGIIPHTEDWEGMMEASALDVDESAPDPFAIPPGNFPTDPDLSIDPTAHYLTGFDPHSGWGLLQAGKLFHMLDPSGDAYTIDHGGIGPSSCAFGGWGDDKGNLGKKYSFNIEDDGFTGSGGLVTNNYLVERRDVTGSVDFSSSFNLDKPIFVWSTGGNNWGWSMASPNSQEPWDEITNGLGGNSSAGGREGIWHDNSSRTVNMHTFQYDIWSADGSTHFGHFPSDDRIGVAFTVFGSKTLSSSVAKNTVTNGGMSAYPSIADKSTTIRVTADGAIMKLTVFNDIGMVVSEEELPYATTDFKVSTENFPEGFYFLDLTSAHGISTIKIFVRH